MKKTTLSLLTLILFIWIFIWIYNQWEKAINIEEIKQSIVIIIPEKDLIEYNKNPEWIFQKKESGWVGSWFFVSKDGKIITAKHIVPNKEETYKVITKNNKKYNAKVTYKDNQKDIAFLKINTKEKIIPLKITQESKKWEEVITFWTDTATQKTTHHYGQIVDTEKKWETLSHLIQISSPLTTWFSWWPVVNKQWKVIWINYALYKWQSLIQPLDSFNYQVK